MCLEKIEFIATPIANFKNAPKCKGLFKKSIDILIIFIYNVFCNINFKSERKINAMANQEKTPKVTTDNVKTGIKNGIMGLWMLAVVASIAFTTAVIWLGTDNWTTRAMTAPMVIFALIVTVKQFSKAI